MSGVTTATVLSVASIAATVVGGAMSVIGQQQQASQQKKMYAAQAQQVANQTAYRKDAAKAQAEKIRRAGVAQRSQTQAALAASGVNINEGTALELQKDVIRNSEEDALMTLLSGERAQQSGDMEAGLLMQAGKNASTNARYGMASTVLSTAGSVASGWKTLKDAK
jgi:hypothetical protein